MKWMLFVYAATLFHIFIGKRGNEPTLVGDEPTLNPEELLGLVDEDLKSPLDIREVIGRIVDGSRFEEYKPLMEKQ